MVTMELSTMLESPQSERRSRSTSDSRISPASVDLHSLDGLVADISTRGRLSPPVIRTQIAIRNGSPPRHSIVTQRSRSAPNRRSARRKSIQHRTFSVSHSRSTSPSEPTSPSTPLSDASLELREEVLNLFRLILRQETSPFRSCSSDFSISVGNITISSGPTAGTVILTETRDTNQIRASTPATPTDFYCKTWLQQKRLLEREFRRLLIWDAGFKEKSRLEDHGIDIELTETSFTALAISLAESLGDNMMCQDRVDHIMQLSKPKDEAQSQLERGSQPRKNVDLLEDIRATVDLLLKSLHSHKRKHASDSTAAHSRPAKTSMREGRTIESINAMESRLQETMPPPSPSTSRKVQFSADVHVLDSASEAMPMFPTVPPNPPDKGGKARERQSTPPREHKSPEISPDHRIVLKIANRVNGFREATNLPQPSPFRSTANPRKTMFKRLNSTEFPSNLIQDTQEDLLVKELKKLQLEEQDDLGNITSSLIAFARFREESLWDDTDIPHLMSEINKSLRAIDSSLALHASLPEWQIHFMRGKNQYAKSAISIICFSILNEIAKHTHLFVSEIVFHLDAELERVSSVVKPIVFFYACIEKLSKQNKEMGTKFQVFQPEIEKIIESLEILRQADVTGMFSSESCATFRHCEPLSLACYSLSTADQTMPATLCLEEEEIPSGLESLAVRDLFGSPSKTL
ncbi:hypothetical protein PMIN04_011362 [Paraphaeosphaeria minitans]